jgi:carbon-monoxide dehydrogenase medium subunit/xanthine dehydrogenase FAD-binding subunit
MNAFTYIACSTLDRALEALDAPDGGRVLAGGTDLLLELRRPGRPAPSRIVDIGPIRGLRGITIRNGEIHIGPLTTHADMASSEILATHSRLLSTAAAAIGSPQIRNRGTIGGNIMNAAACADTVPPLCALEARLTLASSRGTRQFPITQFFKEPYATFARPDEVLTQISFPLPPPTERGAFIKLGRRNAVSISRLSVAAIIALDPAGVITRAVIVPGAAFPAWQRVEEAEASLLGRKAGTALFAAAGRIVAETMVRQTGRRWSTEYKEPVLAVLVRRALEACCAPGTAKGQER